MYLCYVYGPTEATSLLPKGHRIDPKMPAALRPPPPRRVRTFRTRHIVFSQVVMVLTPQGQCGAHVRPLRCPTEATSLLPKCHRIGPRNATTHDAPRILRYKYSSHPSSLSSPLSQVLSSPLFYTRHHWFIALRLSRPRRALDKYMCVTVCIRLATRLRKQPKPKYTILRQYYQSRTRLVYTLV